MTEIELVASRIRGHIFVRLLLVRGVALQDTDKPSHLRLGVQAARALESGVLSTMVLASECPGRLASGTVGEPESRLPHSVAVSSSRVPTGWIPSLS